MDDLFTLDRDVKRAAAQERGWLRKLRDDADAASADAWFEPVRHVTTRSTFESVSALPASDPMREPLRRWIYRLAMTRITQTTVAQAAAQRQKRMTRLESPERGLYSTRELVHRALAEKEAARRRLWVEGLADAAVATVSAERQAREAAVEIGLRLGVGDGTTLLPYDGAALGEAATELLARTDDLARAFFAGHQDWAGLLGSLVAREVPGVWPGGSSIRWTVEQFRATPLLEAVTLDLGPAPAVVGASSFARSLARFGAAYARGAPATGATFVHAHDPSELGALCRGALFAGLLADPTFLRQRLALSPEASRRTARALGATFLAEARLDATRSLVDLALVPASDAQEAVQEALKVRVPQGLLGVMPRPKARARLELLAALLARADADRLRDRFDEDWFRNPHALRHLRESDAAPYATSLPKGALVGAAPRLAAWFEQLAA